MKNKRIQSLSKLQKEKTAFKEDFHSEHLKMGHLIQQAKRLKNHNAILLSQLALLKKQKQCSQIDRQHLHKQIEVLESRIKTYKLQLAETEVCNQNLHQQVSSKSTASQTMSEIGVPAAFLTEVRNSLQNEVSGKLDRTIARSKERLKLLESKLQVLQSSPHEMRTKKRRGKQNYNTPHKKQQTPLAQLKE